jgi:hypothetical protein
MLTYADAAEVTNMRPMSLRGSRFAAADVLEREGAMVPATGTHFTCFAGTKVQLLTQLRGSATVRDTWSARMLTYADVC